MYYKGHRDTKLWISGYLSTTYDRWREVILMRVIKSINESLCPGLPYITVSTKLTGHGMINIRLISGPLNTVRGGDHTTNIVPHSATCLHLSWSCAVSPILYSSHLSFPCFHINFGFLSLPFCSVHHAFVTSFVRWVCLFLSMWMLPWNHRRVIESLHWEIVYAQYSNATVQTSLFRRSWMTIPWFTVHFLAQTELSALTWVDNQVENDGDNHIVSARIGIAPFGWSAKRVMAHKLVCTVDKWPRRRDVIHWMVRSKRYVFASSLRCWRRCNT